MRSKLRTFNHDQIAMTVHRETDAPGSAPRWTRAVRSGTRKILPLCSIGQNGAKPRARDHVLHSFGAQEGEESREGLWGDEQDGLP